MFPLFSCSFFCFFFSIATLCIRYCHAILHGFDQRLAVAVEQGLLESGSIISNQREAE